MINAALDSAFAYCSHIEPRTMRSCLKLRVTPLLRMESDWTIIWAKFSVTPDGPRAPATPCELLLAYTISLMKSVLLLTAAAVAFAQQPKTQRDNYYSLSREVRVSQRFATQWQAGPCLDGWYRVRSVWPDERI